MPEVWGAGVRRPLTARSVIASTLLGVDPPRLPTLALVRSGELFGLREGATRTALSRMTAAGELVVDDGHHALAGPLLERHARQRRARRSGPPADWDGSWLLLVVTAERRPAAERATFRARARRLGLAELREGVWVRPEDGHVEAAGGLSGLADQAVVVRGARPEPVGRFVDAFDLAGWRAVAEDLIAEMAGAQPALDERRIEAVADGFVTAAAVLRHLVADPALPTSLVPEDWPGSALRDAFDRFDAAFKATWRAWYRSFRSDSGETSAQVRDETGR